MGTTTRLNRAKQPFGVMETLETPGYGTDETATWDFIKSLFSSNKLGETDTDIKPQQIDTGKSFGATGSWEDDAINYTQMATPDPRKPEEIGVDPSLRNKKISSNISSISNSNSNSNSTKLSLGATPAEKKPNALKILGMLFRGLGATSASFDQGLRAKGANAEPGQRFMQELLKEEEMKKAEETAIQKAVADLAKQQQEYGFKQMEFSEKQRHNKELEKYYGRPGNSQVKAQEIYGQALRVAQQENIPMDDALIQVTNYYKNLGLLGEGQPVQTSNQVQNRPVSSPILKYDPATKTFK